MTRKEIVKHVTRAFESVVRNESDRVYIGAADELEEYFNETATARRQELGLGMDELP